MATLEEHASSVLYIQLPTTPPMSTAVVEENLPEEQHRRQFQTDVYDFCKVPLPVYHHATPSVPWPWMSLDADGSQDHSIPPVLTDTSEWGQYPQALFANWTRSQMGRSQILVKCSNHDSSTVYKVSVFDNGEFDQQVEARAVRKDSKSLREYWNHLETPPPSNIRLQALFVENMMLPILQILGTKYNVEPFFFTSSANWIPSRYQEDPKALEDHITVVLPFVRAFKDGRPVTRTKPWMVPIFAFTDSQPRVVAEGALPHVEEKQTIDIQAPLPLPGNKTLYQDLLSLHMIRNTQTSTILSSHPDMHGTSANRLHSLVRRTGDSVYWSKIFKRSKDPTVHFLAILWYAVYAWDEAFEVLLRYINALEHDVLQFNDIRLTRELHKLQAYLSYYQQLLREFLRSIEFVRDTPNPAMDDPSISRAEREDSAKLLRTEADNLIGEIKRLIRQREMMSDRLENAINMAFATVGIMESEAMQTLAEVTLRDSVATKQMAYLSIVFPPVIYLASMFCTNDREINPHTTMTLARYIAIAFGLTMFTSWFLVACRKGNDVWHRILWPLFYVYGAISSTKRWIVASGHRPPIDNPAS